MNENKRKKYSMPMVELKKVKILFIPHLKNTSLVFYFIFLYPGSLNFSDKPVIY